MTAGPCGARNRRAWFTLLEVLVALVLLSVAVTLIIQVFSGSLRMVAASEDYLNAVVKAEEKMRELTEGDGLEEGTQSDTTPEGYTVDVEVKEALEQRTADLPVKVLAIDLTIRWKVGTKDRAMTLRTMKMVDREI